MYKRRVLFILHLPPPIHGAAIVGKQVKDIFENKPLYKSLFINIGTSETITDIGTRQVKKIFTYLSLLWKVIKEANYFKPHLCYFVINANGPAFIKDSIVAFIVKAYGIPIIFHLHNKGISEFQNKFFYDALYKKVYSNGTTILLSNLLFEDISKYVPIRNVMILPNGIPIRNIPSPVSKNINPERLVSILYLSNYIETKGVITLMESCLLLKNAGMRFMCRIIGSEGDVKSEQLNNFVRKHNMENYFEILEAKYGLSKVYAFLDSDIFVLPTHDDCFPLVLLEAMNYSLPIVTTSVGAIQEMVIDGISGFVIDPQDPYSLSEKLKMLLNDSDLRNKMGQNGRDKLVNNFTISAFEQRLCRIFDRYFAKTLLSKNIVN